MKNKGADSFQDGGTKPEVVFRLGFLRRQRDFAAEQGPLVLPKVNLMVSGHFNPWRRQTKQFSVCVQSFVSMKSMPSPYARFGMRARDCRRTFVPGLLEYPLVVSLDHEAVRMC